MNPYVILAIVVAWGASCGGSYIYGRSDGKDIQVSIEAREQKIAELVKKEMLTAAASAISEIEVKNVTIQQRIQKEIIEKPVYRDCKHTPDGLRAINDALGSSGRSSSDSKLSGTDSIKR